ncbi:jg1787 [Pararge aegeria aegeria]|uniref:Jg1787 protein n=1 Tax=Pararge aegeria aegeria TaxID=348720 RepID=A0A8S4RRV9_9NEOP|nr:jg1787 [Pararge aegeria aegeria]
MTCQINIIDLTDSVLALRAVTDPRDGRRVALKKLPNVFQSLVSSKRVFRELKMLCFFKHENVLSALDILQPPSLDFFQEMYPLKLFLVASQSLVALTDMQTLLYPFSVCRISIIFFIRKDERNKVKCVAFGAYTFKFIISNFQCTAIYGENTNKSN